jgi:hypothetical protein
MFFLRMIARACPDLKPEARRHWKEAQELHLIFSKIRRSALKRMRTENDNENGG